MSNNAFFEECLKAVLFWEKTVYTNNPGDLGGPTKYGITQRTLASYRGKPVTAEDVRNLTYEEAADIYKKYFWDANNCDLLPKPIALLLFDGCVNQSGVAIRKALQSAIGKIVVDGNIGPRTALAAENRNVIDLVNRFMTLRALRYADSSTFGLHGRGWFNRMFDMHTRAIKLSTLNN